MGGRGASSGKEKGGAGGGGSSKSEPAKTGPQRFNAKIEGRDTRVTWNGKMYGTKAYVDATPLDSFSKSPTPYKAVFDSKTGAYSIQGNKGDRETARQILQAMKAQNVTPFNQHDFSKG